MEHDAPIYWQNIIDSANDKTLKEENHSILGLQFPEIFPELVVPHNWQEHEQYYGNLSNHFPVRKIRGFTWEQHKSVSINDPHLHLSICITAIEQMMELARHGLIIGDRNSGNFILEEMSSGNVVSGKSKFRLIQVDLSHAYDVANGEWRLNKQTWYPKRHLDLSKFSDHSKELLFDEIKTILSSLRYYLFSLPSRKRPSSYNRITEKIDTWIKFGKDYFTKDPNFIDDVLTELQQYQSSDF
ncbi:MAG TPA: hypothetical protein VLH19_03495 [Patescibacteria group bacterium]|nr:hypothetical protein [Patescibacteria group bacterium]